MSDTKEVGEEEVQYVINFTLFFYLHVIMSATFLYCVIKRTFLIVAMFLLSSREEDGKKIAYTHYFIHLISFPVY